MLVYFHVVTAVDGLLLPDYEPSQRTLLALGPERYLKETARGLPVHFRSPISSAVNIGLQLALLTASPRHISPSVW